MPETPREFRLAAFCPRNHRTTLRVYEGEIDLHRDLPPETPVGNTICQRPGCGKRIEIAALSYHQAELIGPRYEERSVA